MTTPLVEQAAVALSELKPVGFWRPGDASPVFEATELGPVLTRIRQPLHLLYDASRRRVGLGLGGTIHSTAASGGWPLLGTVPALYPEWLGDRSFAEVHGVRFPYVAGEMANGIATTQMCIAMAQAGMLGCFGAGGLAFHKVEAAVSELSAKLGPRLPWGVNLIHSPQEPELERRVAALLIERDVPIVSTSAFMALTLPVVHCAAAGLHLDAQGRVVRKRRIFAKVSRREVAARFMSPSPPDMLQQLVSQKLLTAQEAELARRIPVADDVTIEADSGGHTDNQSLVALLPTMLALRDELVAQHGYQTPLRVGAAGGLGTPASVAAAFAMGAAYVVTGSINQASVEAGISDAAKAMLAQADVPDVVMAPAADMFELGVKVQVLKRGTMFGVRASKLYEAFQAYPSLEAIPQALKDRLEREVLRSSFEEVWVQTQQFWSQRDPLEVTRAQAEPKHRMALVFRWYLGKASRWAIDGEAARQSDFQVWCGPAMGAFNGWVQGSVLAEPRERTVVQIALNLIEGAAVITRAAHLRNAGVPVTASHFQWKPRRLSSQAPTLR